MSDNPHSAIDALVGALWNRAARSASATFHRAIDDIVGLDSAGDAADGHRRSAAPTTNSGRDRALEEDALEEVSLLVRSLIGRADEKYRSLLHELIDDGGPPPAEPGVTEQIVRMLAQLSSGSVDTSVLRKHGEALIATLSDAIASGAFDGLRGGEPLGASSSGHRARSRETAATRSNDPKSSSRPTSPTMAPPKE